jgi:hypothetical protein
VVIGLELFADDAGTAAARERPWAQFTDDDNRNPSKQAKSLIGGAQCQYNIVTES